MTKSLTMRETFLLIDPGVGHICNFPEQRKLVTTSGSPVFRTRGYERFGLVAGDGVAIS